MENGGFPLVSSALHPDGVVVAVDVDDVEVRYGGVALTLATLRFVLFKVGTLGISIDGEDFVRVEFVAFPTNATRQTRFVHHFAHSGQQIVLGQDLFIILTD